MNLDKNSLTSWTKGRRERFPGTQRNFEMGTDGYRVPARKKILGTDGYRVPARKKKFWYRWVPGTGKIFTHADPWYD